MRGLATFLVKALTIVGAGGGPLILQVYSSSKIAELPRKFQWTLNLNLNSQGSSGGSVEAKKSEESYWLEGLNKNKWQGVEQSKWGELSGKTARSAYKLAFRSSWIQEEDKNLGDKSAKGALALIKASWGGFGGAENKEARTEEIKVGQDKRVWLIIAKSESSIYLIPVVRASTLTETSRGRSSSSGGESEATKKNWKEGVEDIGNWTREFDKNSEWEKGRNENLQNKYRTGMWIKRVGSKVGKKDGKTLELRREDWKKVCYEGGVRKDNEEECQSLESSAEVYQNAGRMSGRVFRTRGCENCKWSEEYFALDVFVFGDSSKFKNKNGSPQALIQEMEINDKITQVMGVRLDQVVISDTGIGEGKKNEIKWGSITKPTLIRELLK